VKMMCVLKVFDSVTSMFISDRSFSEFQVHTFSASSSIDIY
jgi:hypothetical protein